MRKHVALASMMLLLVIAGCKREERKYREATSLTTPAQDITVSGLHPAQPTDGPTQASNQAASGGLYSGNAYAVSEGQKLYNQYNCVGCHANGGGGIGPPLMDDMWIYGAEPQSIRASIVQGRPNGMPSFRGKISEQQVWEIVAYVRSMSGQLRKDVAPGRSDDMYVTKTPQSTPREQPKGPSGVSPK
jgi:cytochrome c oxidase cbb3-type subunit III